VANGDQSSYHVVTPTTFIDATNAGLPFPAAIAWDPACDCWAVDNVFFGPVAVEWFDTTGRPLAQQTHAPIPANFGGQFSPFGMAFDAQGDLFVVDIHVQVNPAGTIGSQSLQAGPANQQGRLLEFTFTGPAANPPTVIASGEDFPVAVTTCDPTHQVCPLPAPANGSPMGPPASAGAAPAPATAASGAHPHLPATGGGAHRALAVLLLVAGLVMERHRLRRRARVDAGR
jgi:hypothetical protein